jgi:hypothetical protein
LQLVLDAVDAAQQSLRFAMFYLTDDRVQEALSRKANVGEGILDAVGAAYVGSRHDELCAHGMNVKVENFAGKLHHKLGVFDAEGPGATTILGSANWTKSGFGYNDESMLLVVGGAVAQAARLEYEALYDDAANQGLECCDHSAEGFNDNSPWCGALPCVCDDGLDNDYDNAIDAPDSECVSPFVCSANTSAKTAACQLGAESSAAACGDCFDNDGDPYLDGDDWDCPKGSALCSSTRWATSEECLARAAVCGDGHCRTPDEDCSSCVLDCGSCGVND